MGSMNIENLYKKLGGGKYWSLRPPRSWQPTMSLSTRKVARLEWALSHCLLDSRTPQSVVECGVGAGGSLGHIVSFVLRFAPHAKVYGFDSFEGFPEASKFDNKWFRPDGPNYSVYREFSLDQVQSNLSVFLGRDSRKLDQLKLHKGWIPQVFDQTDLPAKIALLHIDLDLYEPYRDALARLFERVDKGGLVIFDEYDSDSDLEKWPGAKKAIDEFCAERQLKISRHWTGLAHIQV